MFSIYDSAVAAYMRPFCAQSEGQAIRMFHDEAVRAGSEISRHPEDYVLFFLGEFTDHDGQITSFTPKRIAQAWELVAKERQGKLDNLEFFEESAEEQVVQ